MASNQHALRTSPLQQQRPRSEQEHNEPHPVKLHQQPSAMVGDAFVFPTLQQRRLHSRE
jgi:hypothetical protein